MNTKILLTSSAVFLGICGILVSFLSQEFLSYLGIDYNNALVVFTQILGAFYLGFAMLNWMTRGNLFGGIYGRPVVVGNLTHFTVSAIVLLKALFKKPDLTLIWILCFIYLVFALIFALVLFTHPARSKQD